MVGEHLTKLGHRRVLYADAHLAWTGVRHYSRDHRLAGARAALAEVGGDLRTWLPSTPVAAGDLADAMAAALARERPTAVIAYGAIEASAVVYAAARAGIRLPDDLSLATFAPHAEFIGLPIATAMIDGAGVGLAAGDMLVARIADPRRALPPVLVPFSFTPGATLAPAR